MRYTTSTLSVFSTASLYPDEVKAIGPNKALGFARALQAWHAASDAERQAVQAKSARLVNAWKSQGDRAKCVHVHSTLADLAQFKDIGANSLTRGLRLAIALMLDAPTEVPLSGSVWLTLTIRSQTMQRAVLDGSALSQALCKAVGVWLALPVLLRAHCQAQNAVYEATDAREEGATGQTNASVPRSVANELKAIGGGNISRGARTVLRVYVDVREGRTPTLFAGFAG